MRMRTQSPIPSHTSYASVFGSPKELGPVRLSVQASFVDVESRFPSRVSRMDSFAARLLRAPEPTSELPIDKSRQLRSGPGSGDGPGFRGRPASVGRARKRSRDRAGKGSARVCERPRRKDCPLDRGPVGGPVGGPVRELPGTQPPGRPSRWARGHIASAESVFDVSAATRARARGGCRAPWSGRYGAATRSLCARSCR